MRLLILGGTVFVGRHIVRAAQERGHDVALFNRGKTNPDLFPGVEQLRGDRDGDLSALDGGEWDAVVDTSGYVPRVVRASAERLAGAVEQYTFISSLSVYPDLSVEGLDESAPVATLDDPTVEEVTGETYGPLKALCEEVVQDVYGDAGLVIRPGVVVGPHDPTDRFTYWPVRVARGGDVLAPSPRERRIQFIDGRDLATWTVHMIEEGKAGIYNATGPEGGLAMAQMLSACRRVAESDARFVWVDEAFLLEHDVQPWVELPLWLAGEEAVGFGSVNVEKAVADGLRFRPLEETAADTLQWASERPADHEWRAGLSKEREEALLRAWRERSR
ncbi:MAG: NAD-dependent epimerase/dehydratase family protein [Candidatus Promineifilaceae bacterium]|nr:NAD-dependent epimerase/dehydratase family protein [Candidatus Promineifilaceae bacterium]